MLENVQRTTEGARHITLIDPAKQSPDVAAQRAMLAVECGSKMVFVGGSTDTPDDVVHATCTAIQEAFELRMFAASQDPSGNEADWDVPVVLFPGGNRLKGNLPWVRIPPSPPRGPRRKRV